jgi:hypothetical protein
LNKLTNRILKKLFSTTGLILFLLALSAVSCEKKENNVELLVGKWNQVSQKTTEYENREKTYEQTITLAPKECVIEFLSDGTENVYWYDSFIYTANWEFNGDLLIITVEYVSEEMEFTVNENTLTLKLTIETSASGIPTKTVIDKVFSRV